MAPIGSLENVDLHQLLNSIGVKEKPETLLISFDKLDTYEKKVNFVSELLAKNASVFLDAKKYVIPVGHKHAYKSDVWRKNGNKSFQSKDYIKALRQYSSCIAAAPFPQSHNLIAEEVGEELALGFANRSAVLFHLMLFDECISDIDQALMYNYPAKLKFKLLARKVKCFAFLRKGAQEIISLRKEALDYLHISSLSEEQKQKLKNEISSNQQQSPGPKVDTLTIISYDEQTPIPPKSHGQHPHIPSASNCVEIKYNSKVGRFLEATRDIRPGDVIAIEKPYASILNPGNFYTHCHNCFIRCSNLIPCQICSRVMFCGEKCRSEALKTSHSIECSSLSLLVQHDIEEHELLAFRIIMKASAYGKQLSKLYNEVKALEQEIHTDEKNKGFDNDGQYRSELYSTMYHLTGNVEKEPSILVLTQAISAARILHCLKTYTNYFKIDESNGNTEHLMAMVGGLLLRQMLSTTYVTYGVQERGEIIGSEYAEPLGIASGAYALLGLINHSCVENVLRSFHRGDTAILRALKPIAKGEEIVIVYNYPSQYIDRNYRQKFLRNRYQFTCECEACINDWPLGENLSDALFKCPTCGHPLEEKSTAAVVSCKRCHRETNITDLNKLRMEKTSKYQMSVSMLLMSVSSTRVNHNEVILQTGRHMEFIDSVLHKLCKEYLNCQYVLTDCITASGNCYILSKELSFHNKNQLKEILSQTDSIWKSIM